MASVKIYSNPSMLYRYRPLTKETIDREVEAIVEAYIYCPKFSQMNDPMEGAHRKSLPAIVKGTREHDKEVLAAREKLGIASLSEVYDHEPMWAHYADKFGGLCIAFYTRKLLEGLPDDVDLIRMAYSEKAPILPLYKSTIVDKAKLTLATKTVRWASEREWRIISPSVGKAEYRNQKAVSRIYLGSRINRAFEDRIISEMKKLKIPVVKMKIDKYAIEFSSDVSR